MDAVHLIAFNLTLIAAFLSPGPALLVAMRTTLAEGRLAGIFCGFGLALSATLWTVAALLGLDSLFALVPWAYVTLKSAGAAYLAWIAYQTWRHARDSIAEIDFSPGRALRTGLMVNLSNPKVVLFSASALILIFPPDLTSGEMVLIVLNQVIAEATLYTCVAFGLASGPARRAYLRMKHVFDRFAALVLGALAARLILER